MRSDRLLSIVIIISQKGLVTGQELANHFEVSLRTIYRDIEKISEAGIPIAATGGTGGGYYLMENFSLNNLFLNKKEIGPLMAVMENLKFLFGKNQQFNDLVLKFETLHDREQGHQENLMINMSHFSMEQELREYLFLINQAIEEQRTLEFDYINRKMDYAKRVVEPIQIVFTSGQWYVTAFCRTRDDYRRFKLVRVRNLRLGEPFAKRSDSLQEIKKNFHDSYEKNCTRIVLKFTSRIGEQLGEYFSKETIRPQEDGTYVVEDLFPDDEGLKKFILGFGDECEVLAPVSLRTDMVEYIKKIYAKYNG